MSICTIIILSVCLFMIASLLMDVFVLVFFHLQVFSPDTRLLIDRYWILETNIGEICIQHTYIVHIIHACNIGLYVLLFLIGFNLYIIVFFKAILNEYNICYHLASQVDIGILLFFCKIIIMHIFSITHFSMCLSGYPSLKLGNRT